MHPLCQAVLLIPSPSAKTVALGLLVAFFVVVIAVVPLEFGFYRTLKQQPLGTAVALEIIISVDIVLLLAGVILDWYTTPQGIILLLTLMILLLVLAVWFVYWRFRLIAALYSRATLKSRRELERLLSDMARAKEQAELEQRNVEKEQDTGGDSKKERNHD